MAAPVTQGNSVVTPPAVEEEPKEDGEEFEDLSAVLEHLSLSEYKNTFDEEKIDIESLVKIQATLLRRSVFFALKVSQTCVALFQNIKYISFSLCAQ